MRKKSIRKDRHCKVCGKLVPSQRGREFCDSLCYSRYRRKQLKEKNNKED